MRRLFRDQERLEAFLLRLLILVCHSRWDGWLLGELTHAEDIIAVVSAGEWCRAL